ncbi:MAG: flagellar biosynthesis anti-sigma factor FlgM [Dehalococcoidia bacterium]|nr:flagellar biosynthesis anti-sigma factor FlgM [Dehalococcoidia bacterium]
MSRTENEMTMQAMPLAKRFNEKSRAAKVAALKAQVASGRYRPGTETVAAAMLEAGVIGFTAPSFDLSHPAEMQRAMRRFVVERTTETPVRPGGRLRVVSAG